MKIPNNLPWGLAKIDFHVMTNEEWRYAAMACNNFPKAIELLKSTLDDNFLPEELQDEIEEFLEKELYE